MGGIGGINPTTTLENVKVRPKRDTFSSSITLGPEEYSIEKYSPPLSPISATSPITPDTPDSKTHSYPPPPALSSPFSSPPPLPTQVHINVEQTIHRDDGEIENDLNSYRGGSDKASLRERDSITDYEKGSL